MGRKVELMIGEDGTIWVSVVDVVATLAALSAKWDGEDPMPPSVVLQAVKDAFLDTATEAEAAAHER